MNLNKLTPAELYFKSAGIAPDEFYALNKIPIEKKFKSEDGDKAEEVSDVDSKKISEDVLSKAINKLNQYKQIKTNNHGNADRKGI